MKIVFVVNVDWFFLSHRLLIAIEAVRQGHEVFLVSGDTGRGIEVEQYGIHFLPIPFERGTLGVFSALRTLLCLIQIFYRIRPDVVHLVTIKPVIMGGVAALISPVGGVVYAISGLGFLFTNMSAKAQLLRRLVMPLYRLAFLNRNKCVIFQNEDDAQVLGRYIALQAKEQRLISGSGVDLRQFAPTVLPDGVPVVIMACRLLADKGVREFVDSAALLQQRAIPVRCVLVGDVDPANPSSITQAELDQWSSRQLIEWWGHQSHMDGILAQATVVVLPSYREGMPKVLLEAQALGRPVITTDVPGCREAIEAGVTGLLVPARDAHALAQAIELLLQDRGVCEQMGQQARLRAERLFDVDEVVKTHLDIYQAMEARL